MVTRLERARTWVRAYREREREREAGEAMAFAHDLFSAVEALIGAGDKPTVITGIPPAIEALAGALVEYRARETERARREAGAEAAAHLRGAVEALIRDLRAGTAVACEGLNSDHT